jgi:hypothetical protein
VGWEKLDKQPLKRFVEGKQAFVEKWSHRANIRPYKGL